MQCEWDSHIHRYFESNHQHSKTQRANTLQLQVFALSFQHLICCKCLWLNGNKKKTHTIVLRRGEWREKKRLIFLVILLCVLSCLVQKSKNPIDTNKHFRHSTWLNGDERKESIRVHKISMQCPSVYESAVNLCVLSLSLHPFCLHRSKFMTVLIKRIVCGLCVQYTEIDEREMYKVKILSMRKTDWNISLWMDGRKSFDHIVTLRW